MTRDEAMQCALGYAWGTEDATGTKRVTHRSARYSHLRRGVRGRVGCVQFGPVPLHDQRRRRLPPLAGIQRCQHLHVHLPGTVMTYRNYRRGGYRNSRPLTPGRVAKVNTRPGPCHYCTEIVPAGAGQLWREDPAHGRRCTCGGEERFARVWPVYLRLSRATRVS